MAPKHIQVGVTTAVPVNGAVGAGVHGALESAGGKEIRIITDRDAAGYARAFGMAGIASSAAFGAAGNLLPNPYI